MTQDEIIEMAKQADIKYRTDVFYSQFCDGVYKDDLKAFAKLVAEAEREACAKECWKQMGLLPTQAWTVNPYEQCIDAIRARGQA
jgi:hypothetical protein